MCSCREGWSGSWQEAGALMSGQALGYRGLLWEDSQAPASKERNALQEKGKLQGKSWVRAGVSTGFRRRGSTAGVRRQLGGKERWQQSGGLTLGLRSNSLSPETLHSHCFVFSFWTLVLTPSLTYTSGLDLHTSPDMLCSLPGQEITDTVLVPKTHSSFQLLHSVLIATTVPTSWVETLNLISDWVSGNLPDQPASRPGPVSWSSLMHSLRLSPSFLQPSTALCSCLHTSQTDLFQGSLVPGWLPCQIMSWILEGRTGSY